MIRLAIALTTLAVVALSSTTVAIAQPYDPPAPGTPRKPAPVEPAPGGVPGAPADSGSPLPQAPYGRQNTAWIIGAIVMIIIVGAVLFFALRSRGQRPQAIGR